jgi:superfamily II helicase
MKKEKELLAYCGLYCGDCGGYSGEIAESAKNLNRALKKYKFNRTAKSLFSKELKEYDKFSKMLEFMTNMTCPTICRERKDGETTCEIKKCCRKKWFYACYECDIFETCEKLKSLEDLHKDACVKNLKNIKEIGIETWLKTCKRYWFGSEVDD